MSQLPTVTVCALPGLAGEELIAASLHADTLVIGSRGQRDYPALRVSEVATGHPRHAAAGRADRHDGYPERPAGPCQWKAKPPFHEFDRCMASAAIRTPIARAPLKAR
jgi:hypothetical protein